MVESITLLNAIFNLTNKFKDAIDSPTLRTAFKKIQLGWNGSMVEH